MKYRNISVELKMISANTSFLYQKLNPIIFEHKKHENILLEDIHYPFYGETIKMNV